jgi:phage major head subunit gpT-like protein
MDQLNNILLNVRCNYLHMKFTHAGILEISPRFKCTGAESGVQSSEIVFSLLRNTSKSLCHLHEFVSDRATQTDY